MYSYNSILSLRLKNCLLTILELEKDLSKTQLGTSLLEDFITLKAAMENLDKLHLLETDVEKIEKATMAFLNEISLSLEKDHPFVSVERLQ